MSYITMNSEEVKKLCYTSLENLAKYKEIRKQKVLEKTVQELNSTWYRRWIANPYTIEQVKEIFERNNGDGWSFGGMAYSWLTFLGEEEQEACKQLLALAEKSETIQVSGSDLISIQRYSKLKE